MGMTNPAEMMILLLLVIAVGVFGIWFAVTRKKRQ